MEMDRDIGITVAGMFMRQLDIQADGLAARLRGTYAGLACPQIIEYIKSLGVTSVELLPIHKFINDSNLLEKGMVNYWGYNSIGFFSPESRYASKRANTLKEFKEMVARYHEAGLEADDLMAGAGFNGLDVFGLGPLEILKAGLDDAAILQDGDLVPQAQRFVEVMTHE